MKTGMAGKSRDSYALKFAFLAVCFIAVFIVSFCVGRFGVNPFDGLSEQERLVVLRLRLPRVLCAALVGAALSVSGAAYQGIFRNPMASPDILGASTGAGFGASVAILAGGDSALITATAFVFGLFAVGLVFLVVRASKSGSALALVISGVMISSLFSSGTSFVKLVSDVENELPAITYWLMGSFASVKMKDVCFAGFFIAAGLVPIFLLRWRIGILTLSDDEARSVGVEAGRLRLSVIFFATLATSASVSVSGMIGWVGLAIPHISRLVFGEDYRKIIPSSALAGSTLLMLTDDICRSAVASEIPIGILTSLIGAPLFIYLIITGGRGNEC